jgi:hypothetical protein
MTGEKNRKERKTQVALLGHHTTRHAVYEELEERQTHRQRREALHSVRRSQGNIAGTDVDQCRRYYTR